MVRHRRPFIDKKRSTTYNLVYENAETGDEAQPGRRTYVEASKGVGVGRIDQEAAAAARLASGASQRRFPPGHPLAWLEEETSSSLTPEQRRELIELGFPDDGYDYLAHLRVLGGRGTSARLQGPDNSEPEEADLPAGPGVFVSAPRPKAPTADAAFYDAHALVLPSGAAATEEEASQVMGGVTAFTRRRNRAPGGATKAELEELEALVEQAEEEREEATAVGVGDLLDDFILTAMAVEEGDEGEELGDEEEDEVLVSDVESILVESEEEEEDFEEEEFVDEEGDGLGELKSFAAGSKAPPRPGSIASTYWREERHDRKGLLTSLDEQFEHVALEYDEDEIGDLSDLEDDLGGEMDEGELGKQLASLMTVDEQDKAASIMRMATVSKKGSSLTAQFARFGILDEHGDASIRKTKELMATTLNEEDEKAGSTAVYVPAHRRDREQWDAESVLSLRSNLDNHPGRIGSDRPAGRRQYGSSSVSDSTGSLGPIRLNRAGFPVAADSRQSRLGHVSEEDNNALEEEEEAEEEIIGIVPPSMLPQRHKDETSEEKRSRKAAVKDAKRAARVAKKELKQMFKEEQGKAARRSATAQPQAALHLP